VKVKHCFSVDESLDGVRRDMAAVADALENSPAFHAFDKTPFRNIPEGDEVFKPLDYANKLLDRMYDYADRNRIWIE
tara:strand:- start:1921 stop:2151 length:231 start_codon:yes stop_codon:yes gene_type:complete